MALEEFTVAEKRVLVLAPTRRDGDVTETFLRRAGIAVLLCPDLSCVCREIETGAAAILLTAEALDAAGIRELITLIENQPSWSDLPIVLLSPGGPQSPRVHDTCRALGNVTLLEQPAPVRSVISAVTTAVRSRARQYQIRQHIADTKHAETRASELRERLALALKAAGLGTFHCPMPMGKIVWDAQCKAQFGLSPNEEVDFERFYSLIHPEDVDRTRHAVNEAVSKGSPYAIEYRVVHPSSEVRWIRATGRTFFGSDGNAVRFDGTTEDVTDRKRSEERQEFLASLSLETQSLIFPDEVTAVTARMLRQYLNCDRCAYAEVQDENVFIITGDDSRDVPSIVGRWPVAAFGKECVRKMFANEPFVVFDTDKDPQIEAADLPAYRATTIRAVICVPLHKDGRFTAAMAVHQKTARHWTDNEVALVQLVVNRCWESLERARVTRELQESEVNFRQLANTIPQLAWMANPDGSIFWYNDRWYEYTGTAAADMQGWGWQKVHDPAVLPEVMDRWKQSLDTGTPFDMTFPLRGDDGEFRPFLTRVNPLRDSSGQVQLWFGTNTDISERMRLEERFRSTANSAPVLIWISDTAKACTWFNKAWVDFVGRDMEQEIGSGWTENVHPEDLEHCLSVYETHFDKRQPFKMEYRMRRSDGEWRWMIDNGLPLYDGAGGAFSGYIGSCIDITELKAAEEERKRLLEAEKAARAEAERVGHMKDEFLATLSHELRTPLNAILGYATLVHSMQMDPQEVKEAANVIQRNAKAQAQIIEDLLDMNRIIAGKIRLDIQNVSLSDVVNAAIETVAPSAEARDIQLQKFIDPLAGPVRGDPGRLQQVIWNLLTNAVKFTEKSGKVQVAVERVNSHVEISVVDTGQGIEPTFLPHVFDRFRQADSSTTRHHGGLGLGLAIVKQLVEAHGGSVRAKSPGIGKGSTFVVSLPVAIVHEEHEVAKRIHPRSFQSDEELGCPPTLDGVSVLVVDDERDSCNLVKHVLEQCKSRVDTALSAAEAYEKLGQTRYDVLVSDIGMPGEDGYEFLRRVRALPVEKNGRIAAIALTAFARSEDRRRAALAGYQTHVAKPVEPSELVAIVASLAGKVS